jgi:hypothetical protein
MWHTCSRQELWSQQRQPLLGNGSENTLVARQQSRNRQQWSNCEAVLSTRSVRWLHESIIHLFGEMFSMRSVPRLYNEEQLRLLESLEMAVRRVGGWCQMAASLGISRVEWVVGQSPASKEVSTETEARMFESRRWCPTRCGSGWDNSQKTSMLRVSMHW